MDIHRHLYHYFISGKINKVTIFDSLSLVVDINVIYHQTTILINAGALFAFLFKELKVLSKDDTKE